VVAPGAGGAEAEHLPGAVDGQQGAEIPHVAGQPDARVDVGQQFGHGRFMTVSEAAMMKAGAPFTASAGASRARRHDAATSRWWM